MTRFLFQGDPNSEAWHRSEAYELLKDNIKDGKVARKEIYNSRMENQAFPLKNSEIKFMLSRKDFIKRR